ncbi:C-4 sterol methyl oxidase [Kappamyces sp. JEL0829]|nr:C-4 sterol methyl oxidase [Kappamyces sp. JEL0829]
MAANATRHSLTITEAAWHQLTSGSPDYLYLRMGIFLFCFHQVVFFGRFLPYYIADFIPSLQKYKLQPNASISSKVWWQCFRQMILEQMFLHFPLMLNFTKTVTDIGMDLTGPLPSYAEIVPACLFFLVVEDFFGYWLHRALHWGPLYKYIHKVHHTYTAPFGLVAEYGHPAETLLLGIGFTTGPIVWTKTYGMHAFTMVIWIAIRLITTIDTHCGYSFPFALSKYFPLWGGSSFHDFHHQHFVGNYGSSFRFWDWLMGTDGAYNRHLAKQANRRLPKIKQ